VRLFRLLLGWRTLVLFAWVSLLLGFIPLVVIGVLVAGSSRSGFPFVFSVHHSGPPPAFGSTFEPLAFVADLLVYYVLAVAIAAWRERRGAR
jgi:hypothetical protein